MNEDWVCSLAPFFSFEWHRQCDKYFSNANTQGDSKSSELRNKNCTSGMSLEMLKYEKRLRKPQSEKASSLKTWD